MLYSRGYERRFFLKPVVVLVWLLVEVGTLARPFVMEMRGTLGALEASGSSSHSTSASAGGSGDIEGCSSRRLVGFAIAEASVSEAGARQAAEEEQARRGEGGKRDTHLLDAQLHHGGIIMPACTLRLPGRM